MKHTATPKPQPVLLRFLNQHYDDMVKSAIRLSNKGERLDFRFSLSGEELKTSTGHTRLRQEVIDYVVKYFQGLYVGVDWDATSRAFHISINLIKAAFTPSQAQLLSTLWKQT